MTSLMSGVRVGLQRPRVALVPRSVSSDAADAAFLAKSYGLEPFDWQQYVLEGWLGRNEFGQWSAPRCGLAVPRQNGKNALLEMRELYGIVALGEKFLHTAHEVKTARKAFMRLRGFFENERKYPELAALVQDIRQANGQEAIFLRNGGSVEFVARSKGSGRGFTADVLVCDEAQEFSDEKQAALLPTISAAPLGNPQYLLTGTPPSEKMDGEVWSRLRAEGMAGVPGRLCWHDWGCPWGSDIDDPENTAAANPSLGMLLSWETVSDERLAMDGETYARERHGVWPNLTLGSLIDPVQWASLADLESAASGDVMYALDASLDLNWAALALSGRRSDGLMHVSIDNRPGRGLAWVVPRCKQLSDMFGARFLVDRGGPAWSLVPELEDAGVQVIEMTLPDVRQACGMFLDAVVEGRLRHRGQPDLDQAVAVAQPRPVGEGGPVFGRKFGEITSLNAAAFAHWWAVSNSYDVLQSVF